MHSVVGSVQSSTGNGFSGPAFQNLVRSEGGGRIPYLEAHYHEFWWCHTTSKVPTENSKTFDDVMAMTFS